MFITIEKSKNKTKNYEILSNNLQYYLIKEDNLMTQLANLIGVLDIDSESFSRFDSHDKLYLEKIINKVVDII